MELAVVPTDIGDCPGGDYQNQAWAACYFATLQSQFVHLPEADTGGVHGRAGFGQLSKVYAEP